VIVLVLTACPEGLRGHLTRWLIEVSAGVYVGRASTRVRDELWDRTVEFVANGRALMIHSAPTEQGFAVRSHGHHWEPVDIDGITLMLRPHDGSAADDRGRGWSAAAQRRRRRSRR